MIWYRRAWQINTVNMDSNHSDEVKLLLMTCTLVISTEKQDQINHFLEQHALNWEHLLALATRHRLTPFVYRTLRQFATIPDAFLNQLQQDYRISTTDNLLKLHQYQVIDSLLAENGIDHLPLKGIRLALRGYPDSSLRISGDIDVLVRKEDVVKTIDVLKTQSYQLSRQHSLHWQHAQQTIFSDLYEVSLTKPFANGSQFDIDLHWQIMGFNKHYASFDLTYVRADPDHTLEREVILLVIHHGVTNVWQQIYYIDDLYFLLGQQTIDWSWLMQECQKFGFERVFLAGLYWCHQIWSIDLPPDIRQSVESLAIATLANDYAKNWDGEQPYEFSDLIARQAIYFVKAQTRLSKQAKIGGTFLSSRIFKYSVFKVGQRFIYVPPQAGVVTVLIRAVQSLLRFLPSHK